jgi:hypothetical protein
MDTLFLPKKFEIQFRQIGENQYSGALLLDGMEMSIGKPKTLEEITAFLMPEKRIPHRITDSMEGLEVQRQLSS